MSNSLCLVLPRIGLDRDRRPRLHWLVEVGDPLDPDRPIASLQETSIVHVRLPDEIRGTLRCRLLEEGAPVAPGSPLLTFVPQNEAGTPGGGAGAEDRARALAEEGSVFGSPDHRSVVVAEVTDMKRLRPIALVGLIYLLGTATTILTTLVYLILGGLAPLLVGALALSIMALALTYGEQHLEKRDGFPS